MGPPFVVTACLPERHQQRLAELRERYAPPRLQVVSAHLTLLHAVPAAAGDRLATLLAGETLSAPPPKVDLGPLFRLGRGFAVEARSRELSALRRRLQAALAGQLSPQDRGGLRLHVTLANKLTAQEAEEGMVLARAEWQKVSTQALELARWAYLGGPWQPAGRWAFAGR